MPRCQVCFRQCDLKEGSIGFCGARIALDDRVTAANYGTLFTTGPAEFILYNK